MIKNGSSRRLILICVIFALVIASFALISACQELCSNQELISSIGKIESKQAGLKASIQKLSSLVQRCPETKVFRVMWIGPGDYPNGGDRHALLYSREHNRIGYEDDFLSGISGESYYADDGDIRSIAEKKGLLTDFTLYERRPR